MIPVTKTFLPPQEIYNSILKRAWDNQWLTNRGELVQELEDKLKDYLQIPNITLTTNGTLPLHIALKALGITGEVITTPFSYVATTAVIVWENCTPVFVDIDPEYWTIDETKIEAAITSKTQAILATHVFGNPCNIVAIDKIAKKYKLKVIYDAAHTFGVNYLNKSIFEYGDVSTCSFHATKIFHTGEGGAFFCNDKKLHDRLYYHHNFGHKGFLAFHGLGVNAKMSELQAAMGLAVLPYYDEIKEARKKVVQWYDEMLDFSKLKKLKIRPGTEWNFSYYPIVFNSETELLAVQQKLNENDIFPRRYFYPSLNHLPYVQSLPMAHSECIASRILCLPLYQSITRDEIIKIVNFIC